MNYSNNFVSNIKQIKDNFNDGDKVFIKFRGKKEGHRVNGVAKIIKKYKRFVLVEGTNEKKFRECIFYHDIANGQYEMKHI